MKIPALVRNFLTSRRAWLQKMLDPRRDIDSECGHPAEISIDDYERAFSRGDIASRIVSLYPNESWSDDPDIYESEDETETEFEKAWDKLKKDWPIFTYLHRADVLSGIGRYGVLLLGLDDGVELLQPVQGINEQGEKVGNANHQLIYLRPLDERVAKIQAFETDVKNPRYGQPTKYEIQFSQSEDGIVPASQAPTGSAIVHWSRIIHLADNRTNSEVYGSPRMKVVFDRLLDLKKIAGGSGEMFWKGGFPGISLESHPQLDEDVDLDKESTKEQMDAYMNGLQRYIATVGLTANSLTVQVADPIPHLNLQLSLVAAALSVPLRVLLGSERGDLASSQDAVTWNKRMNRRRQEYLSPFVLRPFCKRLIDVGVLPTPSEDTGYSIEWPDLNSPSKENKAVVAEKQSNAMSKYVASGVDTLMPPFHFFTLVLGLSDEEANSIIDAADAQVTAGSPLKDEKQAQLDAELAMKKQLAAAAPRMPAGRNGR